MHDNPLGRAILTALKAINDDGDMALLVFDKSLSHRPCDR